EQHRDPPRARPDPDGRGEEEGGRSRARGVPRRPHAEKALRGDAELARRREDRAEGRLNRPIRSFGLRQGRTTPAQKRALEDLLPKYGLPFTGEPLSPLHVFGRKEPLGLELG